MSILSNYRIIMIGPTLSKMNRIILEKKVRHWLKCIKRDEGQVRLTRYYSMMDHPITLRIIVECHNHKANLFCCFINFRKYFGIFPMTNHYKRLEEIKVPLELTVFVIRLYENVISKFRTTKVWLEEINSNIKVKQWSPLSPTL